MNDKGLALDFIGCVYGHSIAECAVDNGADPQLPHHAITLWSYSDPPPLRPI